MKKGTLFAIGLLIFGHFMPEYALNKAAAKRRLENIKKAKKTSPSPKKGGRQKRAKRNLGYIRGIPNKIITLSKNPAEGFLVNEEGQKHPILISDKKTGQGFYLGSFYDLDDWTRKYAYLK